MATKAVAGKGLQLAVNTGSVSSPTYTPVGEGLSVDLAAKMGTDDATSFDSSATEYIATMPDGGEIKFTANRVSSDAGQAAVQAAGPLGANAGELTMFKITAPKASGQMTNGDSWTFSALVTEFNPAFKPDKKTTMSGTLRVSNGITYTEGS